MADLFHSDAPIAKSTKGVQGSEYLFGPSERKEKEKKKKSEEILPASMTPSTFFVSRKKKSSSGVGRDIHLDNFDISIAGRSLLKNAQLKLIHGRRFGLVGRNGMGKSTLLRHISGRELIIPDHLQILHVEQEVRHYPLCAFLVKSSLFCCLRCGQESLWPVLPPRGKMDVSTSYHIISFGINTFWAERFLGFLLFFLECPHVFSCRLLTRFLESRLLVTTPPFFRLFCLQMLSVRRC